MEFDVASQLSQVAQQRELNPGRPQDGPYPGSVNEVADEVVEWIMEMSATCASGLDVQVAKKLMDKRRTSDGVITAVWDEVWP
jgi:hypothetical protein